MRDDIRAANVRRIMYKPRMRPGDHQEVVGHDKEFMLSILAGSPERPRFPPGKPDKILIHMNPEHGNRFFKAQWSKGTPITFSYLVALNLKKSTGYGRAHDLANASLTSMVRWL